MAKKSSDQHHLTVSALVLFELANYLKASSSVKTVSRCHAFATCQRVRCHRRLRNSSDHRLFPARRPNLLRLRAQINDLRWLVPPSRLEMQLLEQYHLAGLRKVGARYQAGHAGSCKCFPAGGLSGTGE